MPVLWAADRARSRLWALDGDLIPTGCVHAFRPVGVLGLGERGTWVLEATERGPEGVRDLVRRRLSGAESLRLHLGAARLVGTSAYDDAIVLHRPTPGTELLQRFSTSRAPASRLVPNASCAAVSEGEALVGGPAGRLRLLRASRRGWDLIAERELGGEVRDVGAERGGLWALTACPSRVLRLDRDLRPSALWAAGSEADALFLPGGNLSPWTLDFDRSRVNSVESGVEWRVPGGGLEALRPDGSGGGWAACLGAVLHLHPEHGFDLAQGGFDEVVDVCGAAVEPRLH